MLSTQKNYGAEEAEVSPVPQQLRLCLADHMVLVIASAVRGTGAIRWEGQEESGDIIAISWFGIHGCKDTRQWHLPFS